jgi:diacylglycerol kinase family enzyme
MHERGSFARVVLIVNTGSRHGQKQAGGGAVVAPGARVDDGMLDVYAIELHSWRALAGVAWSLKSGRLVRRDDVPYWRTRRVRITTRPVLPVNMDGELVDLTPELFSVARGILRVLVPQDGMAGSA